MKEGLYKVATWNGKDGTLIDEQGGFETITKEELSPACNGRLVVGDQIRIKLQVFLEFREDPNIAQDREASRRFSQEQERLARISKQMDRSETPVQVIHRARP